MNTETTAKRQAELWSRLISGVSPEGALRLAMQHTAYSLSDLLRRPIKIDSLRFKTIPISQLAAYADDPEAETVGVYVLTGDDLPGQAILILSPDDAMYVADWLLEARPGTTTRLGPLEYSTLAELGNLTLSSFLNAVAEYSRTPLRPSPPAVIVDMLAAVLEVVATSVAAITDELLIIETAFVNTESSVLIRFWVLPDPAVLTVAGIEPR
jgi:chemotaxis protein CheC